MNNVQDPLSQVRLEKRRKFTLLLVFALFGIIIFINMIFDNPDYPQMTSIGYLGSILIGFLFLFTGFSTFISFIPFFCLTKLVDILHVYSYQSYTIGDAMNNSRHYLLITTVAIAFGLFKKRQAVILIMINTALFMIPRLHEGLYVSAMDVTNILLAIVVGTCVLYYLNTDIDNYNKELGKSLKNNRFVTNTIFTDIESLVMSVNLKFGLVRLNDGNTRYLDQLDKSISTLLEFSDSLSQYLDSAEKDKSFNEEKININDIFNTINETFIEKFDQKDIKFIMKVDGPPTFQSSKIFLQNTILNNIVFSIIQILKSGGTIELSYHCIDKFISIEIEGHSNQDAKELTSSHLEIDENMVERLKVIKFYATQLFFEFKSTKVKNGVRITLTKQVNVEKI